MVTTRYSLAALLLSLGLGAGCDGARERGGEGAHQVQPAPAARYESSRLRATVEAAGDVISTRGFSAEGMDFKGFLVAHTSSVQDLSLHAGACYVVVAAGSAALREIDMRLFDGDGTEVAADSLVGARAAVHFCPSQNGRYYLALRAAAGNGLFAVRQFKGPSGIAVRIDDLFRSQAPSAPSP